ncbi:hypothetical protein [Vibrio ouci]|uniref:Alpha/beta hydrolase n=1 Tax=Vibrio ouci TaxID=2499078 RepID=A0A4Y8WHJ2_9VIBR|nr:hypothetical protein [Vibrio ouci]TFH92402.1 hypothetical protein ELS82_06980 [Vibrio ouci]
MDSVYIGEQHECQTNFINTIQDKCVTVVGSDNVSAELAFWLCMSGAHVNLISDSITKDYLHSVSEYNSVLKSRPLNHLFQQAEITITSDFAQENDDDVVIIIGQHEEDKYADQLGARYYVITEGTMPSKRERLDTQVAIVIGNVLPSTPIYYNPFINEYVLDKGTSDGIPLDVLFTWIVQHLVTQKVSRTTRLLIPDIFSSEAIAINQSGDLACVAMLECSTRHEVGFSDGTYYNVYEFPGGDKTVFLVNAVGMPTLFFTRIADYLAKDFRVLLIETPLALIENVKPNDTYFDAAARHINTILERYSTEKRIHILGWSTGCELIERASTISSSPFESVYLSPYLSIPNKETESGFITTLISMSMALDLDDHRNLHKSSVLVRLAKKNHFKSVIEKESVFLQSISSDSFRIPKTLGQYLRALNHSERNEVSCNSKDKVMIISGSDDSITTPAMIDQYAKYFENVMNINLKGETHHSCFDSLHIWRTALNFFKDK